jgi:hypothetical protein
MTITEDSGDQAAAKKPAETGKTSLYRLRSSGLVGTVLCELAGHATISQGTRLRGGKDELVKRETY